MKSSFVKKEKEKLTSWSGQSNERKCAAEEHRHETHPSSAPSVQEDSEENGSRKFSEGGQRKGRENVGVQKFHVPDVAVKYPPHKEPKNKAMKCSINCEL